MLINSKYVIVSHIFKKESEHASIPKNEYFIKINTNLSLVNFLEIK